MADALGRRGGDRLARFAVADLTDGGDLSARGLRRRFRSRRRDRHAQEGLAALRRIQGDPDRGEQPGPGPDDDTFAA